MAITPPVDILVQQKMQWHTSNYYELEGLHNVNLHFQPDGKGATYFYFYIQNPIDQTEKLILTMITHLLKDIQVKIKRNILKENSLNIVFYTNETCETVYQKICEVEEEADIDMTILHDFTSLITI